MLRQFLTIFVFIISTQILSGQFKNEISSTVIINHIERTSEQSLPFKGEGEIRDNLPVYRFRIALPQNVSANDIEIKFTNLIWNISNDSYLKQVPNELKVLGHYPVNIRKEMFLEVELIPFAEIDGVTNRLESFVCNILYNTDKALSELKNGQTEKYTLNSVLKTGKWVKISISESGIHKIPYATLTTWGFSTPANVRIFGYGGEMVPRLNYVSRPDDLPEVALWHHNNAIYFYGQGTSLWSWNSEKNMFLHQLHNYCDEAYYFISDIQGTAKSIQQQATESRESNYTSSHFDDLRFHEQDVVNLLRSGRRWFGEKFSMTDGLVRSFNFSYPARDITLPIKISTRVACRDNVITNFEFTVNNNLTPTFTLSTPAISFGDYVGFYAHEKDGTYTGTDATPDVKISVTMQNTSGSVMGWLDYITVNARSNLRLTGHQLLFRDKSSHGDSKVTLFKLSNVTDETILWDITNRNSPERINTFKNGSTFEFKVSTDQLKEFVAFNPSGQFPVPTRIGPVENQNLHGTGNVDYIIVAPKEFSSQALQLASLHQKNSGLSTLVVNPELIYNEFSWGHKDPTAIRSFMKMLYDRAGTDLVKAPKYLLLFGNGSFDNKTSDPLTKSHIITYQSENSVHRTSTYVTDDYFGFLDDTEGVDDRFDRLDIGIGRFPVKTVAESQTSVDKVKAYMENQISGKWQKLLTFVGDDEDSNIHMRDANLLAGKIENNHPRFDIRKIYLDNYKKITTSTGKKYPEVENLINRTINEGTLIFNYVGHGSENVLAAEQIINIQGIKKWNNIRNLPVFVTATCEFSRFDNPYMVSAGEETFLNPKGGAIALLSTTRVVYSSLNYQLNNAFLNYVFMHNPDGSKPSLGDILRQTKIASGSSINKLNFTLLGDPAIKLAYPENKINLKKINNINIGEQVDTLKALSKILIESEVVDPNGSLFTNFNGTAEIIVYDKPDVVKTIGNDGATPFEFTQYSSIIFKGKATVTNGKFISEFIVPYDIRYNYSKGRISLYAFSNELGQAFGANNDVIVGGFNLSAPNDNEGPKVEMYLNNESFKPGDKTGTAPLLFAKVTDESGINTSGSGIGHDIILIIDGDRDDPIVLNSYFQAKSDTYKEGLIVFQLPQLQKGKHEISLKVWDNYNNSTISETFFSVDGDDDLNIRNFKFYPNPLSPATTSYFSFETDEPNSSLSIIAETITLSGLMQNKYKVQIVSSGNFIDPVPLSLPALGIKTPGIYFVRFTITTNSGRQNYVVQKIVVGS